MNRRHLVALAIGIVTLVAVWGCEYQVTGYPPQPKQTAPVDKAIKTSVINVEWHDGVDSVSKACEMTRDIAYGCVKNVRVIDGRTTICDLHVMDAKDFDDAIKLVLIGHEVRHCFLAHHEAALK